MNALNSYLLLGGSAAGTVLSIQLKTALLLGVAWGISRLVRRGSAAARHCIWTVALIGVVCYPVAHYWLPSFAVDLPGIASLSERMNAAETPITTETRAMESGLALTDQTEEASSVTTWSGAPRAEEVAPEEPGTAGWVSALLLIWAVGAALRLAYLAVQLGRTRWLTGAARGSDNGRITTLANNVAVSFGVQRKIRVLESDLVSMPLTWGALRPTVVLPAEASDWPDERLRVVLLHELAHVRRWDYAASLVAELACAAYWPNPLVWLARYRVHAEQERACDDLVLAAGTSSLDYAEHLLDIARAFHGSRWELGVTVAMARETSLKGRIRAILDDRVDRRPLSSRAGLLLVLALSSVALLIAAARPQATASEIPEVGASTGAGNQAAPLPSGTLASRDMGTIAAPVFLWMEAGDGSLTAPMRIREDLDASSGRYAVVPDGDGNDAPDGGAGALTFTFDVAQPGEYIVWGRVIGDGGDDNSFYVSLDGSSETRWDVVDDDGDARVNHWRWLPMKWQDSAAAQTLSTGHVLASGRHVLRVRNREDGTRLDRVLVTNSLSYAPEGRGSLATSRPAYLWMEAEQAGLSGPMRAEEDNRASAGRFVSVPTDEAAESGTATFTFDVSRAGPFVLWGRTLARDDDANSFFVSVDGGPATIWDAPERGRDHDEPRWTWAPVTARDGRSARPLLLDLPLGRHRLTVGGREKNTKLDGIYITSDLTYQPRGALPVLPPAEPTRIWLEAEDASRSAPLRLESDSMAAGGHFIVADKHVESGHAPPASGSATFTFNVQNEGVYTIWGRTIAPDDSHDSFWVRVNDSRWIRWNDIHQSRSWRWSTVNDADHSGQLAQFEIHPGKVTIDVAYREGGTRLDRLLVTDDPAYRPTGMGGD